MKRAWILLLGIALSPSSLVAQQFTGFDDFLRRYGGSSPETQRALAQEFIEWQQVRGGFPIMESNGDVVFFYRGDGDETDVRLVGDFGPRSFIDFYWDASGEPLIREGTIFYQRRRFEPDARLDYAFVVDGERTTDPLNPRTILSGPAGGTEVSELVMADHVLPTQVTEQPGVPGGTVQLVEAPWASPKVVLYLPPGYDPSRSYPTLYTADGTAWVDLIRLPTILDNLIVAGDIQPVIAVMIDATQDRNSWYTYNPDYLSYLERVVDYVDERYATKENAAARLHAGTSAGGRATVYVGLERPDLFGNLAMLSPSFAGPVSFWEPYFSGQKRPDSSLRMWISAGTYEGYIHRDVQTMEAYFERVGIPTEAVYLHQGHSFGAWREGATEMLKHFFPGDGK